ncbi:hypothetical protein QL285_056813 [Trifolium repens]|nr:hypothetical protein QL285_056813 [Trifolium repens]
MVGGWFGSNISSVIGDGKMLGFWKEKWIGMTTLKSLYPNLYLKSSLQNGTVSELGSIDHNGWKWRLDWSAGLLDAEAVAAQELLNLLSPFQPRTDLEDRHKWIPSSAGIFTVKSANLDLLNRSAAVNLDDNMLITLGMMWKNNVPSKISIFGWRLLLEKLPTKEALFGKGIITDMMEKRCVLCPNHGESIQHFFLHCNVSNIVWSNIFKWMGVSYFTSDSVQQHFTMFGDLIKDNVSKRHRHIIWLATTWCM